MTGAFISVADLVVAFGPLPVVNGIAFDVATGEQVTLLGPSGCGKTTTLRALAGLEHPVRGRITIDGQAVFDAGAGRNLPPERRGLSMVFQSYAIWPHMNVFDNVAFSFKVRGIAADRTRAAVDRALALVDLAGLADRPASRLSGGQQQRVALARAIAIGAKAILFDEPLSNLDAQLRTAMREELAALRKKLGFTALYVTHDQDEAFSLSDRIIIMRAGRIEQQGRPSELYRWPRTRFVANFLGIRNILPVEVPAAAPGEPVEVRLAPDILLVAVAPWGNQAGKSAVACFRPIDVRVTLGEGPGIAGVIVRTQFTGDLMHYFIRSASTEICAYDRPRPDLVEGSAVNWSVPPDRCLILGD